MDTPGDPSSGPHVVVVPVRSFRDAKSRLADVLDDTGRSELARRLADGVLDAVSDRSCVVVTGDDEVARWATGAGAEVLRTDRRGLADEVGAAYLHCLDRGAARVTVVPGDLARPAGLADLLDGTLDDARDGVVIVPDRHGDGTNLLSLPRLPAFRFRYGPGSADAHRAEAARCGAPVVVVTDPDLGWDVDVPADLTGLGADTSDTL